MKRLTCFVLMLTMVTPVFAGDGPFGTGYTSNKKSRQASVRKGGWKVAWGKEINETHALSAAAATYFSGGVGGTAYVTNLLNESQMEMMKAVRQTGNVFAKDMQKELKNWAGRVISDSIRQRKASSSTFSKHPQVDVKAGVMTYSGGNMLFGKIVAPTFGMIPYVAVRIRVPKGGDPNKVKLKTHGPLVVEDEGTLRYGMRVNGEMRKNLSPDQLKNLQRVDPNATRDERDYWKKRAMELEQRQQQQRQPTKEEQISQGIIGLIEALKKKDK